MHAASLLAALLLAPSAAAGLLDKPSRIPTKPSPSPPAPAVSKPALPGKTKPPSKPGDSDKPSLPVWSGKKPFSLTAYISVLMGLGRRPDAPAQKKTGSVTRALGEGLRQRDASLDAKVSLEQISTFSLTRPKASADKEGDAQQSDEDLLRLATIAACRERRACRVSRGIATASSDGSQPPFVGLGGKPSSAETVPPTLTEGGFMPFPGRTRRLGGPSAFTESDSGESVFVVVLTLSDDEALDTPPQLEADFLASSSLTVTAAPTVVEARFTVGMADGAAWQPSGGSSTEAVAGSEDVAERFGSSVGRTDVLSAALGFELTRDMIVVIPTAVFISASPRPSPVAGSHGTPSTALGQEAEEGKESGPATAMIAGAAAAAVLCLFALLAGVFMLVQASRYRRAIPRPALRRERGCSGAKKDQITVAQAVEVSACGVV